MIKNIIIGILAVLATALFFYGTVQQIEANRNAQAVVDLSQKLKETSVLLEREKIMAEIERMEAEKQKRLASECLQSKK